MSTAKSLTNEPNSGGPRPPSFDLLGNLCLDFINTLDDRFSDKPKELLADYSDLAKFGEEAGVLTPAQYKYFLENAPLKGDDSERALRSARKLREALYKIFRALMNHQPAPQAAMDTLNAKIHDAALHSQLVQTETASGARACEWRFDDLTSSFEGILWPITRAAADLLASPNLELVRACSSPTCQWLFLDTSKNHRRRWCSMRLCGNRAKVKDFYARKRESAAGNT